MDKIARLKDFLAVNPADNFVQHALAMEYIKAGDDAKAQELLENILNNDQSYIGSYYHLAKLLERNHKESEAVAVYEKGITASKAAGDQHAYNELVSAYEDLMY